ncbi:MAG: protocatechuate 3,4-dioxygenase subunit beta [Alphaproteobacteria bacterium]|nr:protocatechuate 3,4-dioxygenase subunit beta [Alphaproteobacteria bacterium]
MKKRTSTRSDRTQPLRRIAGYPNTLKRSGGARFWPRLISLVDTTGPAFAPGSVAPDEADLSRIAPGAPRALGQLITVSGRVLDESGRPVSGCLMELWHANAAGKYIHHNDPSPVPADRNFRGHGRILTDAGGRFRFRTIKPGGYAVPDHEGGAKAGWWRPPHLHFSLFGAGSGARLVTQMFFPGEPLNRLDLILNSIPDKAARDRLVLGFVPRTGRNTGEGDAPLDYRQDFVLRGRFETPFEGR